MNNYMFSLKRFENGRKNRTFAVSINYIRMKQKILSILLILVVGFISHAYAISLDGPYIIYNNDGSVRIISVTADSILRDTTLASLPTDFSVKVQYDEGHSEFTVPLHKIEQPKSLYSMPKKLFVCSDPHGRMDCFLSLLQGNGIVDKDLNWAYGKNHLMIIGDVFDRGDDVLPIFWLIYKLEAEAEAAGGKVSFLLGNHETLVLMNDLRYTNEKYTQLAKTLGMKYPELFAKNTELGRWLNTRNTIEIIGKNLFTHAGLSREFYDQNLTIDEVNKTVPLGLYKRKAERKEAGELIYFLYATYGPIWYRGLVREEEKYHPVSSDTLNLILKRYHAKRIIVGHTIFDEPSFFYNGRVIAVNVDNAKNKAARKGRAVLIEGKKITVVGE